MSNEIKYKVIKSLPQYNEYCDRHEKLMLDSEEKHQDEIELLELLIEEYDERESEAKGTLNPVELLTKLMEENEIGQSELAKSINVSRQLLNDVLKYRRSISKAMAVKLSAYFAMNLEAFGRVYELPLNSNGDDSKQSAAKSGE